MFTKRRKSIFKILTLVGLVFFVFGNYGRGVLASVNSEVDSQIEELNSQLEQRQNDIDALKQQQAEYQAEISAKQKEASTLEDQIEVFNLQIVALEDKIGVTEMELEATGLEIDKLTEEIREKEIEIAKQKDVLGEVLIALYQMSGDSTFEIILENSKLSEFVDRMTYINDIQVSLKDQLTTIKVLKEDLEARRTKVEDKKAELDRLYAQLDGERRDLDAQRQAKKDLLAKTQMMEAEFQKLLAQAQAEEQANDMAIQNLANQISWLSGGSAGPGYFQYPLPQNFCVTAYFMDSTYCPFGSCGPHYGIDLGAWSGTPVYAAAAGTAIVHAAPRGTSGLNYVTIMHPDVNMTTMYLHLSGFAISGTTNVSRGQVIGYTGGAFGSWGSGLSTGPHLHFEMRKIGEGSFYGWYNDLGGAVNPQNYIPFGPSCW